MRRSCGTAARRLLASIAVAALLTASGEAEASTATELVRIAHAHEEAHHEEVALRRYMEALALDPTHAEAYLGLGNLRVRRGDLHEAERVYSVALEHLPQLRAAQLARAHVRRALGATAEAARDLLAGMEDDVGALRVLASWYGEDGLAPAQLSIWRHIAARAEATHDTALRNEARTMVRALVLLVGIADPAAGASDRGGVRATLSVLARRGV